MATCISKVDIQVKRLTEKFRYFMGWRDCMTGHNRVITFTGDGGYYDWSGQSETVKPFSFSKIASSNQEKKKNDCNFCKFLENL